MKKRRNKAWLALILVLLVMLTCICGGAPETPEPTDTPESSEQRTPLA